MRLTHAIVTEAVGLGTKHLTSLDAFGLAKILGVRVIDCLRCLDINGQFLTVTDGEIAIPSAPVAAGPSQLTAVELWEWWIAEVAGGQQEVCLPISSQDEIKSKISTNAQGGANKVIQWEDGVAMVAVAYLDVDANGSTAIATFQQTYPTLVQSGLSFGRLATINGQGVEIDQYIFGVQATPENLQVMNQQGFFPFRAEMAQAEYDRRNAPAAPAPGEADSEDPEGWTTLDAEEDVQVIQIPIPTGPATVISNEAAHLAGMAQQQAATPPADAEPTAPAPTATSLSDGPVAPVTPVTPVTPGPVTGAVDATPTDPAAAPGPQTQEQPAAAAPKQTGRRSKAELDALRNGWVAELQTNGVTDAEALQRIAPNGAKFKEAEKEYKALLAANPAPAAAATPAADPAPAATPTPTPTNSEDIKSQVMDRAVGEAAAAGGVAPTPDAVGQPAAPAQPAAATGPVSPAAPAQPSAPAPLAQVGSPPPPTEGANSGEAQGLLNNLLGTTGQ